MINKLKTLTVILGLSAGMTYAQKTNHVTLNSGNMLIMNDYFSSQSVAKLSDKALELDSRLPAQDPIFLVMDTGGGSIDAGLELIGILSSLNRPVHTLTIFSASMGFHTVTNLGERFILSNGTLMTHRARGSFGGSFPGELDSRYSYYLKRIERLDHTVVARSKGKLTFDSYRKLYEHEFWCDGQDCVDKGIADKVVTASCDKSVSDKKWVMLEKWVARTGNVIELMVEKSSCPLITGFLDYNIYVDGNPLFSVDLLSKGSFEDRFNILNTNPILTDLIKTEIKEKLENYTRVNRNVIKY